MTFSKLVKASAVLAISVSVYKLYMQPETPVSHESLYIRFICGMKDLRDSLVIPVMCQTAQKLRVLISRVQNCSSGSQTNDVLLRMPAIEFHPNQLSSRLPSGTHAAVKQRVQKYEMHKSKQLHHRDEEQLAPSSDSSFLPVTVEKQTSCLSGLLDEICVNSKPCVYCKDGIKNKVDIIYENFRNMDIQIQDLKRSNILVINILGRMLKNSQKEDQRDKITNEFVASRLRDAVTLCRARRRAAKLQANSQLEELTTSRGSRSRVPLMRRDIDEAIHLRRDRSNESSNLLCFKEDSTSSFTLNIL